MVLLRLNFNHRNKSRKKLLLYLMQPQIMKKAKLQKRPMKLSLKRFLKRSMRSRRSLKYLLREKTGITTLSLNARQTLDSFTIISCLKSCLPNLLPIPLMMTKQHRTKMSLNRQQITTRFLKIRIKGSSLEVNSIPQRRWNKIMSHWMSANKMCLAGLTMLWESRTLEQWPTLSRL